ncbi:nucleoside monophosphate kinase [Candidatus Nomurabacteria bacterium]|nr:nucleoside monophosphate kinase [Candidatus Nomurabacteria bacterium]
MQSETFVFFGIVGSGKGTQINLLMDVLKAKDTKEVVYVYPGNEYRKLISSETYVGNLIKDSLSRGELQPNFLTNTIFNSMLISNLDDTKHLIADGYPRTLDQSENFESTMQFFKRDKIKIIYIEVGREEAMKRNLLRGRNDDTKEGLEKRFDEYVNNVVPSMNYFKNKNNYEIFSINGEQSVEDVHKDIIKALKLVE